MIIYIFYAPMNQFVTFSEPIFFTFPHLYNIQTRGRKIKSPFESSQIRGFVFSGKGRFLSTFFSRLSSGLRLDEDVFDKSFYLFLSRLSGAVTFDRTSRLQWKRKALKPDAVQASVMEPVLSDNLTRCTWVKTSGNKIT